MAVEGERGVSAGAIGAEVFGTKKHKTDCLSAALLVFDVHSGVEVEISSVGGVDGLTIEIGVLVTVSFAGIEGAYERGRLEGQRIA